LKACPAWLCAWQSKAKKLSASRKRPRFSQPLRLKNKTFFRKKLGRVPLTTIKNIG
jgi:hypothetical protein